MDKNMTKEMIDIKYEFFEKKRKGRLVLVLYFVCVGAMESIWLILE